MSGDTPRLTAEMAKQMIRSLTPKMYGSEWMDALTSIADGTHVVVPREPTKEMVAASFQCGGRYFDGDENKRIEIAWHAMIDAALAAAEGKGT